MSISGVRKMFEMAASMKHPVDLSLGLPDFDTPAPIMQAAIAAIREGKNRYTPTAGILPLREALQKKFQRQGVRTSTEQILVTGSASGGLDITLAALLNKGDPVMLMDPYFVGYKQLVLKYGGKPVPVSCKDDFSPDMASIQNQLTKKTKAIIINSPNNPTGHVCSRAELKALASIAGKYNTLIISDEVYEDFVYTGKHVAMASLYPNTVTINAFSKSYAMTGWRIGYLTGPQHIVDAAMKVQQYSYVCAPTPFQHAALVALQTNIHSHIVAYKKKRNLVYRELKENFDLTLPDGAFYYFIRKPTNDFVDRCTRHNLLVVPGEVFSEHNTHFRLSYATANATLNKAVRLLNRLALQK